MYYYLKLLPTYLTEPGKVLKHLRSIWRDRRSRAFVVSYPKAGRTWLRLLVGRALCQKHGLRPELLLHPYTITVQAGLPRTTFSHGGPLNFYEAGRYDRLRFHHRRFNGKKVVFLVRDIRDTTVSWYFQESRRSRSFAGTLKEFIRSERFGARKIVSFYNLWHEHQGDAGKFLLVKYEDLHSRTVEVLEEVLTFLGEDEVDPAILTEAVEFASFDSMKRMETAGQFSDGIMRARDQSDRESAKVRKGKVGGYEAYLDDADQTYFLDVVREMGIPGCDWYLHATAPGAKAP